MPKTVNTSNYNQLQSYLNANRAGNSSTMTHTSLGKPAGAYYVKPSEHNNFMDLYHNVVFDQQISTYLVETLKDDSGDRLEYQPLKIDLDFRYYSDECIRIYKLESIAEVCMKYMEVIDDYLEELDDDERIFYILEKPSPTKAEDKNGETKTNNTGQFKIKDGIHIMAPDIVINEYLQLKFREHVYKNCGDIFDKYGFDNPYSDIFDRAVIVSNGWQMYGSTKPNQPPYKVTHMWKVYKDRYEEVVNIPEPKELIHTLSIRNKYDNSMIRLDKQDEVTNSESEYRKKNKRSISVKKKKKGETKASARDIKLIIDYVNCLSVKRASNYNTWIEVGWCLYNLHNKDDRLLNVWIEFSKKAIEYEGTADTECSERWEEMHEERLGMPSLKMWAEEDNPEEYDKIKGRDTWKFIMEACKNSKGSSYDVARVMHAMYKDEYTCISIKDTKWFFYHKSLNRWVMDDKGIRLKEKISTDVYKEFKNKATAESNKSDEAGDASSEISQKIFKVMYRLKETAFKANIMIECAELFYDRDKSFFDKLDSYNYLLGFNNGVYNLRTDSFAKGRPEDFISKSTNINYIKYDENNSEIKAIMTFYTQIFVLKNIRDFVLTRSASFLSGSTRDESFDIYSGKGGNGKSKHMELMSAVFGDYAVNLPIQLITAKRSASNAATPELARTKGARLCIMQEPDTTTKINVGLMKELTGGDKIQARALYGEPVEFKPQFKMVLCCNDKPELPPHDEGTWRRVRNTEFISKFTQPENIQEDNLLDFKIDMDLSERFDNWAEPFMTILLHYHKKYKTENVRTPDEILEYTSEYREKNNHFRDFINDRIEYDPNYSSGLTLSQMYDFYRKWYQHNHADDRKIRPRKELQLYMDDRFGKYISTGVLSRDKGYKGLKQKPSPFIAHGDIGLNYPTESDDLDN